MRPADAEQKTEYAGEQPGDKDPPVGRHQVIEGLGGDPEEQRFGNKGQQELLVGSFGETVQTPIPPAGSDQMIEVIVGDHHAESEHTQAVEPETF